MRPPRLLPALLALLALLPPAASRARRPPARAASTSRPQGLSLFVRPYNYLKFRDNPPSKGHKLKMQTREFTKGDYPWREPQTYMHKLRMPGLRANLGPGQHHQLAFDLDKFRRVRPRQGKFEEDAERGRRDRIMN